MKYSMTIALGIIVSLAPTLSSAECVATPNLHGDFGIAALGAPQSKLRSKAMPRGRCDSGNNCTFVDARGISYFISDGVIVRKEIDVAFIKPSEKILFDIVKNDSILTIVKKLQKALNYSFWYLSYTDGTYALSSDLCLKNSVGETYDFFVMLDEKGHLKSIGARIETEKD